MPTNKLKHPLLLVSILTPIMMCTATARAQDDGSDGEFIDDKKCKQGSRPRTELDKILTKS